MRKVKIVKLLPQEATYDELDSPVGNLTIITSPAGLHAILWDIDQETIHYKAAMANLVKDSREKTLIKAKEQLIEYFQGKRTMFDLPLVLNGTDFQMQAWQQLMKIPYAETISYAEQARRVGDKNKARAVGMANGRNPISIIVPCHRVIGSAGHLTGFGGGIERKAYLLNLEKIQQLG
jgi:methylated-DNA-[protein]-cysteine S-methyltransferase